MRHGSVPDRPPRMPRSARTVAVDGSGVEIASLLTEALLVNLPMVVQREVEEPVVDMVMQLQHIRRLTSNDERPMLSCTMCKMALNTIALCLPVEIVVTRQDWVELMLLHVSEDGRALCKINSIIAEIQQAHFKGRNI